MWKEDDIEDCTEMDFNELTANSAYHLLFRCLLIYVCLSFPLMFRKALGSNLKMRNEKCTE